MLAEEASRSPRTHSNFGIEEDSVGTLLLTPKLPGTRLLRTGIASIALAMSLLTLSPGTAVADPGPPAVPGAYGATVARVGVTDFRGGCGLIPTNRPRCWSANWFRDNRPPIGKITSITGGGGYACGLRPWGTAVCWGGGCQLFRATVRPDRRIISLSVRVCFACG